LSNVIAFSDSNPDKITRPAGDFTADGFAAGDKIMVVGSWWNDGVYTINNASVLTLTLAVSDSLQDESADPAYTVIITTGVLVRVNAPDQTRVRFTTTRRTWDGGLETTVIKPVNSVTNQAEAVLCSSEEGGADILVSDVDAPATSDSLTVTFSKQ
jgi:hypothetical protein